MLFRSFDPVNFHPMRNDATLALAPGDLVAFLASCGHVPVAIDFRQPSPAPI